MSLLSRPLQFALCNGTSLVPVVPSLPSFDSRRRGLSFRRSPLDSCAPVDSRRWWAPSPCLFGHFVWPLRPWSSLSFRPFHLLFPWCFVPMYETGEGDSAMLTSGDELSGDSRPIPATHCVDLYLGPFLSVDCRVVRSLGGPHIAKILTGSASPSGEHAGILASAQFSLSFGLYDPGL
jgi:hypothetical protein